MSQVPLAPPPPSGNGGFDRWVYLLWRRLTQAGQILWSSLDTSGSNLTDIETRNHNSLQNLTSDDHTQYILANGSRKLTADWDAGDYGIVSKTLLAGEHASEGEGVLVNGVVYNASLKASDINNTHLADIVIHRHSTTNAPNIVSARSHSIGNSHGAVIDGDILGRWLATGWVTNSYYVGASTTFVVDGTPGIADMPTSYVISTSPEGSDVPVERVRFKPNGVILWGDDSVHYIDEFSSTPSTPTSGKVALYAKSDGKLYSKDDTGVEVELGGGASSVWKEPVSVWNSGAPEILFDNTGNVVMSDAS